MCKKEQGEGAFCHVDCLKKHPHQTPSGEVVAIGAPLICQISDLYLSDRQPLSVR